MVKKVTMLIIFSFIICLCAGCNIVAEAVNEATKPIGETEGFSEVTNTPYTEPETAEPTPTPHKTPWMPPEITAEPTVKPTENINQRDIYLIKVNLTSQIVSIYRRDESGNFTKHVKDMLCSAGIDKGDTPTGVYEIYARYDWLLMVDKSYAQYCTRFNGPILFHSIPYFKKDPSTLMWEEYNKLGEPASHGCVRLRVEDAKWLYDYCEDRTIVEVFYGDRNDELNQSLRPDKITSDVNWDPTDPDPYNPFYN